MLFPVFTWIQWNIVCFYLPGKAVVYLVAFHLFFVMFVWSYWMTIFTSPASPSKEVNLMLVNYQMLSLMMGLFSLCYLCWNSITWSVCSVSIHKLLGNCVVNVSRQPLKTQPTDVLRKRPMMALRFSCAMLCFLKDVLYVTGVKNFKGQNWVRKIEFIFRNSLNTYFFFSGLNK